MGYSSQAGHVFLRTQPSGAPGVFAADMASAGVGLKLRSGSLGPSRTLLVPDAEIGGNRDVADAYLGTSSWSGDYSFYTRMDSLPTLLGAALGLNADTAAGSVYTHTMTPSDASQLPFLSVEEQIGAGLETYRYTDTVVNTLHLEAEANGYLSGTAGLIAIKQVAGATPTTGVPFDDGPMIVGTNITVTYNGVTLPAHSFSLDVTNNIADDDWRLGSFYLGGLDPKRREVTASFSLRHQSSALWRQAVYGTPAATQAGGVTTKQQLVITCTSYENVAATTPYSLTITIPKFVLNPFNFSASGDDIIDGDVSGQALRPVSANGLMTAVVVNGKAAVA